MIFDNCIWVYSFYEHEDDDEDEASGYTNVVWVCPFCEYFGFIKLVIYTILC